jgi:hypothetical protein
LILVDIVQNKDKNLWETFLAGKEFCEIDPLSYILSKLSDVALSSIQRDIQNPRSEMSKKYLQFLSVPSRNNTNYCNIQYDK